MLVFEELVSVSVATNGASGQGSISGRGALLYVEVEHTDVGDPDYYLQVLNRRGTLIWTSPLLTGNTVVWISEEVPATGSILKIKDSTLAGSFKLWPNYKA